MDIITQHESIVGTDQFAAVILAVVIANIQLDYPPLPGVNAVDFGRRSLKGGLEA